MATAVLGGIHGLACLAAAGGAFFAYKLAESGNEELESIATFRTNRPPSKENRVWQAARQFFGYNYPNNPGWEAFKAGVVGGLSVETYRDYKDARAAREEMQEMRKQKFRSLFDSPFTLQAFPPSIR
jgi:hypothetical protein